MIRRLVWPASLLALGLALPAQALAETKPLKTDPTKEFLLEPWIKIPKIGPSTSRSRRASST